MKYITTDKYLWWANSNPTSVVKYYKHDFLFSNGQWRNQMVSSCIGVPSQVVIVGHSDFAMTDDIALRIKKETNCQFLFAINNHSSFEWVYGIPLGLTNYTLESDAHPVFGESRIIDQVCNEIQKGELSKQDAKWIYLNFSIWTAPHKRQSVWNLFEKESYATLESSTLTLEGRLNYLRQLARHKFAICPEGNGVDTHRLWESLYVGTIPIVLRSPVHQYLYDTDLPICWIDDWKQVTPMFLNTEWNRLSSLFVSSKHLLTSEYWIDYIIEKSNLNLPTLQNNKMDEKEDKPRIRLFNLDLHISVIADFKDIVKKMYGDSQVEITDWSISGHTWVFGKSPKQTRHITQENWRHLNPKMIQDFVNEYRDELSQYDGFIVTHTPVFALLYESFRKPIIIINSCRYEQPFCWNGNLEMWHHFNSRLIQLERDGLLITVSNNRADQEYLKKGSGLNSTHIPSLCEYTNIHHRPLVKEGIIVSNEHVATPGLRKKAELGDKYEWSDLYRHSFFVHIPYEISTMSMFEQYSSGAPLVFPTPRWLCELYYSGKLHFWGPYAPSAPPGMPALEECLNGHQKFIWWIQRADYYDQQNYFGCYYVDNQEELYKFVSQSKEFPDPMKSPRMLHITKRRIKVFEEWHALISKKFPSLYRIN